MTITRHTAPIVDELIRLDALLEQEIDLDLHTEHICQSDHTTISGHSTGTCLKTVTHRWRATHATGRTLNICVAAAGYAAACMKLPNRACVCGRPASECWHLYPI
ncbi:MAG: hypothetical protein JWM49_2182 [Microbacteriaceae bacterium]|jgi:hypothetical protein|nr:hypothetical protein [Microbacteriaceae bacterium]